jgi:hypothetical protein
VLILDNRVVFEFTHPLLLQRPHLHALPRLLALLGSDLLPPLPLQCSVRHNGLALPPAHVDLPLHLGVLLLALPLDLPGEDRLFVVLLLGQLLTALWVW